MDGGVEAQRCGMDGAGAQLCGMDGRVDGAGAQLCALNGKIEARQSGMDGAVDGAGAQVCGTDGGVEAQLFGVDRRVEAQLCGMDGGVDSAGAQLYGMDEKVEAQMCWMDEAGAQVCGMDDDVDGAGAQVCGMDRGVDGTDAQVCGVDRGVDGTDAQVCGVDRGVDGAGAQVCGVDRGVDGTDAQVCGVDRGVDGAGAQVCGMDGKVAEQQCLIGGEMKESEAQLCGEFTDPATGKVHFSLTLTDSCIGVRKTGGSPAWPEPVQELSFRDCVGCRAHRGEDEADTAAYLSLYLYPVKSSWTGTRGRYRLEHRFRFAPTGDPHANLAETERWARAVRCRSSRYLPRLRTGVQYSRMCAGQRVMVLVNPLSGRGQAMARYTGPVLSMLTEASLPHTLITTEHQNHARELVRNADLSQWSTIVILSGDGLLFEVINGLMEREDWEEAIHTPLGILPGGTGNALAASVHHYSQSGLVFGEDLLLSCGFLLCKGLVCPLDILSVRLSSGRRLFSFLSLAWGFVADVDIESEKFRNVGAVRFIVGTLRRLASLRIYQGRLAFLPAREDSSLKSASSSPARPSPPLFFCSSVQRVQNTPQQPYTNKNNIHNSKSQESQEHGPCDDLLPALGDPVPTDWMMEKEQDFVLVLATCHSHLAEELMAAPDAHPDDGYLHLLYITAGISRPALLRLILAMEKGAHLACECPYLVYRRVKALRLEPITKPGVITVDGEQVEYGPIQAQVHKGYARLISG
ncbi:sphingosine kinase 2-like [Trichomycterus rosablanca]|uniref:sphingosine kinase 2-like n=1 Tax=Trichomycterus rosablanca TaxID=2290929 RepID=UPI002F35FEFB